MISAIIILNATLECIAILKVDVSMKKMKGKGAPKMQNVEDMDSAFLKQYCLLMGIA